MLVARICILAVAFKLVGRWYGNDPPNLRLGGNEEIKNATNHA